MHTVIQLSDLHLVANANSVEKGRNPHTQLSHAIEHAERKFPGEKIFVITGDLVNEITPATYRLLASVFKKVSSPVYIIPGNHDDAAMLKQHLTGDNIFHTGEIHISNWLLILLDSSTPGEKLGSGRLADEELSRLENLLQENSTKDILIFIHHPPILIGKKSFQQLCLENRNEFDAIIQEHRNIKVIAFGHAHTQLTTVMNHQLYTCCPSTWLQTDHLTNDKLNFMEQPGGYNWYRLEKDGVLQWGTHYFY